MCREIEGEHKFIPYHSFVVGSGSPERIKYKTTMHLEWELGDVVRGPEDNKSFFFFKREREREVGGGLSLILVGIGAPGRMKRSNEGWFS